ncbi:MAG: carotenoid biosynthesis protein [Chloroflexi bacterium]|nr:carotenoid biosynthesis protein [Chloroflexota bacterium]
MRSVDQRAWGGRRALTTIGVIVALAWLTEFIGHTTGFPFGSYDYTPRLQPQVGGVPLLIPLAWLMMLPPAWAMARVINLTPSPLSEGRGGDKHGG